MLDTTTGQTIFVQDGYTSSPKVIRWCPNNADLLLTGGRDGAMRLWDVRTRSVQDAEAVVTVENAYVQDLSSRLPATITDIVFEDERSALTSSNVSA